MFEPQKRYGLNFEPDMPLSALDELRTFGKQRQYRAKQTIVNLTDDFTDLFIVEKGRFSISVLDETGNKWIYGYLGPRSTWGLKAVLTETPASFVFETVEDSVVTCVSRSILWSLIDNNPIVRRGVIMSMGWSITKATEFAHSERTLNLCVRLRNFLIESAEDDGMIKITQADMARVLGVSRYALGSQLQKLKSLDLVEINYGQVRLTDPHRLANHHYNQ